MLERQTMFTYVYIYGLPYRYSLRPHSTTWWRRFPPEVARYEPGPSGPVGRSPLGGSPTSAPAQSAPGWLSMAPPTGTKRKRRHPLGKPDVIVITTWRRAQRMPQLNSRRGDRSGEDLDSFRVNG